MSTENQGAAVAADATPTTQVTPTAGDQQQVKAETETTTDDKAASEGTQDDEQTTDENPNSKKESKGLDRRFNRLTADKYRERARADAAEARAAAAEAKAQELERKQAQSTRASDTDLKPPRLEDFKGSYEEYELARETYVAEKARRETLRELKAEQAERDAKASREAENRRIKEASMRFKKSAEGVAEHYEDMAEVMGDFWQGGIPLFKESYEAAEYVVEVCKRGPEVVYHLANNPDVADRIGKLSRVAQVEALAELAASLPKPNAPATKAPAPPKTIGGRGGSDTKDPAKMSIDEMRKATGTARKVRSDF